MSVKSRFEELRPGSRTWAIAAIHGHLEPLIRVHEQIAERFEFGDIVVYMGNFLGHGPQVRETVDELLLFRREVMALPGGQPEDIVFLRGAQEEMWQKLLTIQFAPNPREVLEWMIQQGVGQTIEAYESTVDEARLAARDGVRGLTQWTNSLRAVIRAREGHTQFFSALHRAAFRHDHAALFVSSGVDPERPMAKQTDSFWWGDEGFNRLTRKYGPFRRVVRGFDPQHGGTKETEFTLTVDGGCGFGGPLRAVCLGVGGDPVEWLEG